MNLKSKIHNNTNTLSFISKILPLSLFILISLSFMRCANMARPTGGPKDSIPPKILSETPPNFTTNFKAKEINILFDEYIKFSNQNKEFSISPDTEKKLDYKIKKKHLIIRLPDSLEQNTTYTINFGKGLGDYNEGNPIINYSYVFSTGPHLDSLTVSGSVKNAFTKTFDDKVDKDVRVLLIPTSQDSIFGKKKANIYTTVDSSGNFIIKNLKEDTYRIYAIKEQNNDRIYNSTEESIGYIEDSIVLTKNISNIKIEYSQARPTKFKITEKNLGKDGRILLTFNQPLTNPSITIIDPVDYDQSKKIKIGQNRDSVTLTLKDLEFDSLKIQISNDNKILDTTVIRKSKNQKFDKTIEPILNINKSVDKVKHITISSAYPIDNIFKEKIILKEDSLERRNFQLEKDTLLENIYHLRYNWKPKKNYELIIQEKAIEGPFGEGNKEKKYNFSLNEADNYGDIKFTLNNLEPDVQYIVELIDEKKDKVFDRQILYNTNEVNYLKFPGGKYTLRVIKDLNKNGQWDPVDVYEKIQAEPIWYLDKTFTIRSNWEQNEKIDVKFDQ